MLIQAMPDALLLSTNAVTVLLVVY